MALLKILASSFLAFPFFTACVDKKSNDAANASAVSELEGTWATRCQPLEDKNFIKAIRFYGASANLTLTIYEDADCGFPSYLYKSSQTFTLGGAAALSGAKKVDFTEVNDTITLKTDAFVSHYNTAQSYGYTDWVLHTAKDVTGKRASESEEANLAAGIIYYTIYNLSGTSLTLGDSNETFDGSTDAKRDNALETEVYTKIF